MPGEYIGHPYPRLSLGKILGVARDEQHRMHLGRGPDDRIRQANAPGLADRHGALRNGTAQSHHLEGEQPRPHGALLLGGRACKHFHPGVIPIIFAVAFLSVPQFVGELIKNNATPWIAQLGNNLTIWFAQPGSQQTQASAGNLINMYVYPAIYFLMIFAFTYFYTSVVFNAKEIAENLQKQGGFIDKIRPGEQTEKYLKKIVSRLNLFGATSLGLLALLPLFAERLLGTSQLTIGGTGLLIVVSVALETLRQLESRALMVSYDQDY